MSYGMSSSFAANSPSVNRTQDFLGSLLGGSRRPSSSGFGEKIPSGYKSGRLQQFTPEQMSLFQQMFGQVSPDSYLSQLAGGDEEAFQQMEAPALRQFSELQGGLASRFSGMGGQGSLGGRRSSGFQNQMTSASSNFAQQLQSQRQAMQRQAIQDLHGMSRDLLGERPYEQLLMPKQPKKSSGFGSLIGAGLGGIGGFFAGGPGGALAGAQLGYGIGSSF